MSGRGSKSAVFIGKVTCAVSKTAYINKLTEKLLKLKTLLEKNISIIDKLDDQIVYLEDKIKRIYSLEKRKEINDWITAKEQKIKDIGTTNMKLSDKIEKIESHLSLLQRD
jgi:hypothetical protein